MSGLEIVALIPAIISAFGTISVEYRNWRKRREERRNKGENAALQRLLAGNGAAVQDEYDEDLRLLGPVFRRGDNTGRESLMHHLIILQSTVISLLRDRQDDISYVIHPNHDSINNTTKSTRNGIITTLSEQYQRLAQARPIARLPAPASTPIPELSNCFNVLTGNQNTEWPRYRCDECEWDLDSRYLPKIKTKDGQILDPKTALDRFHYRDPLRDQKNGLRCYLCGVTMFPTTGMRELLFAPLAMGHLAMFEELQKHIRKNHCFEEFR